MRTPPRDNLSEDIRKNGLRTSHTLSGLHMHCSSTILRPVSSTHIVLAWGSSVYSKGCLVARKIVRWYLFYTRDSIDSIGFPGAAPIEEGEGGGGERLIKDLKRKANSLSRGTRQASALGLEGRPPPHENCSARYD